jgi:hypothetical protein
MVDSESTVPQLVHTVSPEASFTSMEEPPQEGQQKPGAMEQREAGSPGKELAAAAGAGAPCGGGSERGEQGLRAQRDEGWRALGPGCYVGQRMKVQGVLVVFPDDEGVTE